MVFPWGLCDNKSLKVSGTLLGILPDLNNVEVWIVSIRHPISNFSNLLSKPLMTVPKCANYNWYHLHVPQLPRFSGKVHVLATLFVCFFFIFHSVVRRDSKVHYTSDSLLLLLIISMSDLQTRIRRYVCISKSQRNLCVLFPGTYSGLCMYRLVVWTNFIFLHNSQ